jgi:3-hydroxy acid dehydrogenase/malonic semialdehyde reductase
VNNISEKIALITGATSGIGKSCAKELAKMGVDLVITGRRDSRLLSLKAKLEEKYNIEVKTLCFDVSNKNLVEKELESLLNEYEIDILINNAGIALGIEKIDAGLTENWETMIDTNIKGLLYVSKIVMTQMRANNKGHIVNIGSIAGIMPYPGGNVYSATKSAVHAISQSMNIDLIGTKIRVSNIAPGAVRTEFASVRFKGDNKKVEDTYAGFDELTPKDIADLIVYILNAPAHVNIQHTLIMPTAQRNPFMLHRNE